MKLKSYATLADFEAELEKYRVPPDDAMKPTQLGSRKFTSITPQWRVDVLNQVFGPYGSGWSIDVGEPDWRVQETQCVFVRVRINYEVLIGGEEVKGTTGWHTGGTPINRLDEAIKQAETDALGKAASYLGIGAAIYRGEFDGDKYTAAPPPMDRQRRSDGPGRDRPRRPEGQGRERPQRPEADRPAGGPPLSPLDHREGTPGAFIVPWGDNKHKRIGDLSVKENASSLAWMEKKGMTGPYRDALEAWLKIAESNTTSADGGDEALPF